MWMLAVLMTAVTGLGLRVHRVGKRAPRFPQRPLTAVVLGARVHPDGTLSPALVDRVRVAVALLKSGTARRLLFSGGSPDSRPTEAGEMARLALELGAGQEHLATEPQSLSTFENAARSEELLRGEPEIILVSCDFHLARASAHFRRRGLTVWPVPSPRSLTASSRLLVTGKEIAALLRRPWLIRWL